jgi:transposase
VEAAAARVRGQGPERAAEKGAIHRRLRLALAADPRAVVLFEDETILRPFPPLRAAWGWRGEQSRVRISGNNARLVLYGAINVRTGHRLLMRGGSMAQGWFQAFLRVIRRAYPGRAVWLVLDKARGHTAPRTLALAAELGIHFLWLPKQWSELNAMDQLWKELKRVIAANRQYKTVDALADWAERFILGLSPRQALTKAGILSGNFWLNDLCKKFWRPT